MGYCLFKQLVVLGPYELKQCEHFETERNYNNEIS